VVYRRDVDIGLTMKPLFVGGLDMRFELDQHLALDVAA